LNHLVEENVCIIAILLTKCCHNNKHFSELAPHHGEKTAGTDMVWKTYITVTRCITNSSLIWHH